MSRRSVEFEEVKCEICAKLVEALPDEDAQEVKMACYERILLHFVFKKNVRNSLIA